MATRPVLPFDDAWDDSQRPPLSVSELTGRIKAVVEGGFERVLVEGEVSNCRRWSSGHIYFTLKDQFAQLRAVAFRATARQLKFDLEDGMHVIARGRIGVYEVKGDYQLICDGVEPHGLGALQAAFDQLKRRLQAEGLFDAARKRPLPVLPRRIGVVTSLDGAAVRDVLRVLTSRYPGARVVIRPTRVQGEGAARDLIGALRAIAGFRMLTWSSSDAGAGRSKTCGRSTTKRSPGRSPRAPSRSLPAWATRLTSPSRIRGRRTRGDSIECGRAGRRPRRQLPARRRPSAHPADPVALQGRRRASAKTGTAGDARPAVAGWRDAARP